MGIETRHKNELRKIIGGWSEAYEPGRGSGVGYPDLQFLVGGDRLLPVEVKDGNMSFDGFICSKRIRPAQISWHDRFLKAGGISFVFVCWGKGSDFRAWCIPLPYREVTRCWATGGWSVERCLLVVKGRKTIYNLTELYEASRDGASSEFGKLKSI